MQIVIPFMLLVLGVILFINAINILFLILLYAGVPITLFVVALKSKNEKGLFYTLIVLSFVFAYFLFPELAAQLTNYKLIK